MRRDQRHTLQAMKGCAATKSASDSPLHAKRVPDETLSVGCGSSKTRYSTSSGKLGVKMATTTSSKTLLRGSRVGEKLNSPLRRKITNVTPAKPAKSSRVISQPFGSGRVEKAVWRR